MIATNLANWCLAKKNQVIMMGDRGFDIATEAIIVGLDKRRILSYYKKIYKKQLLRTSTKLGLQELLLLLSHTYTHKVTLEKCKIIYMHEVSASAAKKESLGRVVSDMIENDLRNIIIISSKKVSPDFAKGIMFMPLFNIEVMLLKSLFSCPTRNNLVPKFTVITTSGKDKNLPLMLESDAISRWYGFKAGTVVLVENGSGSSLRLIV